MFYYLVFAAIAVALAATGSGVMSYWLPSGLGVGIPAALSAQQSAPLVWGGLWLALLGSRSGWLAL